MEEYLNRKGIGNQSQRIAERVLLLREYLYANASRTKAVSINAMKQYLNDKGGLLRHQAHLQGVGYPDKRF